MPDASRSDPMLVYRDTKLSMSTMPVLRELQDRLARERLEADALLCAGALECALADARATSAERALRLTDAIAEAWVGVSDAIHRARELLSGLVVPPSLVFTRPEGFAFYAVDPASFRALARDRVPQVGSSCAVIGVRSIGTTLSAVVCAELRAHGVRCERHTVRPSGHPFERRLSWSAEDEAFLTRFGAGSTYIVVDEGPGLSGSTLLAVAEALTEAGIARERVQMFCSHRPDPERLVAPNAAARWSRFASYPARSTGVPPGATDVSGGQWRLRSLGPETAWPASWVEQERIKYLNAQGDQLVKFQGFPPYDEPALLRAQTLAAAGWSPNVSRAHPGFLTFEWLQGRPLDGATDPGTMVPTLARYLAFRVEALRVEAPGPSALETMARVNVSESLGIDLPANFELELRTPVHTDGHLMPHEWIPAPEGLRKTDAVDHGDDHLFPGPCDVAWDLAGAVVEWDLDPRHTEAFLRQFARLTGDDARARLPRYIVAYASFRIGLSTFAEHNPGECARWRRARREYERHLRRALVSLGQAVP